MAGADDIDVTTHAGNDHPNVDSESDPDNEKLADEENTDDAELHEDGPRGNDEVSDNCSKANSLGFIDEHDVNINDVDLKVKILEVETNFQQVTVVNKGLANDKSSLLCQIELLKDQMLENEEDAALVMKEYREKSRAYEVLFQQYLETQKNVEMLQNNISNQARLIEERGMVMVGNDQEDNPDGEDDQDDRTRAIVSRETASLLDKLGKGPLDIRIQRLADERDVLRKEVHRLELDIQDERNRGLNQKPLTTEEMEAETKKIIDDYKFKIQLNEQEISVLTTKISRLGSLVDRFSSATETAEKSESDLKDINKRLFRELREANEKIEELETANGHLEARMERLKLAKSNLLKEL